MARKFKTLTKSQWARDAKLRDAIDKAMSAIFAGEMNVPFSQMYRAAPDKLRDAYDTAVREHIAFERELVSEGRGYFDNGMFRAY